MFKGAHYMLVKYLIKVRRDCNVLLINYVMEAV